jgi:type II secretory pathway pseudopilin PulG
MKRQGFSLLEMVVACSLMALVLPLLFNLFPTSLRAMRRSETLQQAVTLATYRMDEAAVTSHVVGVDLNQNVTLGSSVYQVTREYYNVDAYRMDMQVTVQSEGMTPLQMQTRFLVAPPQ